MKLSQTHQADPVLGVMHWQDFMRSVRVKAHVPHEPRRAVPLRLILALIASIDVTVHTSILRPVRVRPGGHAFHVLLLALGVPMP